MPLKKDIKKQLDDLTDNEKMFVSNYPVKESDRPDPEIDKAWLKEISIREMELKSGRAKAMLHNEFFRKYKK